MDKDINRHVGLHYGALSLYTAMLHNIFLVYHVDVFLSIYRIDKMSFWIGETIFLVWNSCNDPLFGWISDRKYLSTSSTGSHTSTVVDGRLRALAWSGPLFAVAFITFWFAWTFPSLQFAVCLCIYDGFLTVVDLHHSALLADLSVHDTVRAQLKKYCSVFSAVGSLSVFVSYIFWTKSVETSPDRYVSFQMLCLVLAGVSMVGFIFSTKSLRTVCQKTVCDHKDKYSVDDSEVDEKKALKKFVKELSGHSNFLWFTSMNLVQVFHCHFNSNFFPLFIDTLLGEDVPPFVCSVLLGVSFMAPHVNNLYFLTLCQRYGAYAVVRLLFFVKLALSCVMFLIGFQHIWIVGLFIASNRVFTEGTCKLLNLVVSDLVDEDAVIHRRQQAVSALIFGTVAFLSKPGQTLAPLIGTWLLAALTGHDVFAMNGETGSFKLNLADMTTTAKTEYQYGVFNLLVTVPMVCGCLQLLIWSRFTLHGKRLLSVKSLRSSTFKYATV